MDYDSTISEAKGGVTSNEEWEETREAFLGRAGKTLPEVKERGTLAYGYRQYSGQLSQNVQTAEEGLKKLGVPVVVFEQMEGNKKGITTNYQSDALAIPGVSVFIHKDTAVDGLEIVGHEDYHYLSSWEGRTDYEEVLTANVDFASKAFIDYQQKYVEDIYFGDDVEIGSKEWVALMEEIFAYITGDVHAGDPRGEVHGFLRDYDAVKAAWDALIEKQAKNSSVSQRESDVEINELAPVGDVTRSGKNLISETPTVGNTAGVFFDDIAPVREDLVPSTSTAAKSRLMQENSTDDIAPLPEGYDSGKRIATSPAASRNDSGKERKWVKTSTESEAVDGKYIFH